MNSDNIGNDTPIKYDNFPNEIHSKKVVGRNRGNSVANGQINKKSNYNNNNNNNSNMYTSPSLSVSSVQTTPLNKRSHHEHSHSHSSSINSNHSSIRYNNIKNMMDKTDTPKSSPLLKNSHLRKYSESIVDNNIKIEISDMDKEIEKSEGNRYYGVRKDSLTNNSLNVLSLENDVTSQLYNSRSNATLNSNTSNDNNEIPIVSERRRLKNERLKTNSNPSVSLKKPPSSRISVSSSVKDSNSVRPPSSDIGSYSINNNQLRPKSSVSYHYESSARTLNNSNAAALNNLTPNVNNFTSNNYLNSNYLEPRKKYSSCYSISSNSTILAPPKKYLNNNNSVYNYPKIKHMLYIVIIMIIIYLISTFTIFSTGWIVANKRLIKAKETAEQNNLIYHYEFGMFKFCYEDNTKGKSENRTCESIAEHCTNSSYMNFNPNNEGKIFEDEQGEDTKEPKYNFCKLTQRSRRISTIYILIFTLNVIIALCILYFTIKYRGTNKKDIKHKLIKRLSYISEHYNNKSTKIKNSNNNIVSNSNNSDLPSIGFHRQYSEPEAMDIESETDTIKSKPNNNDNNNNNNNNNVVNASRLNRYRSNSTHITYNIPNTTTRAVENNANLSPTGNSPLMLITAIEDQNKTSEDDEKEVQRRKKVLKLLFTLLIVFSLILGFIGIYFYTVRWYKEHQYIGIPYSSLDKNNDEFTWDVSIGVSFILIFITSIVNIIMAIYVFIHLSVIHFSRTKTYWQSDADEDTYSQSYDSLHPPSIYSQSNFYPNNYNNNPNTGYPSSSNTYIP